MLLRDQNKKIIERVSEGVFLYCKKNHKNPSTSAILSFIIPGLGFIYNGLISYGIFIFILFSFSIYFILKTYKSQTWGFYILILSLIIIWVLNIIQSYKSAQHHNIQEIKDLKEKSFIKLFV